MAGMTLDQLRIFLAVAKHLHFTRAGDELYITQPAVSAAIQSLELEYGVKLFHRIGRHVEIAEAGQLLEVEAKKILDSVAQTERGLRELNNLQRGKLKLGSSLTIGNYWLPEKIGEFQRRYPGITISCTLANTEEICLGTATGLFDLGLVEGEVNFSVRHLLQQDIIGGDSLQIVVGQSHPWFDRPQVSVQDLTSTEWVMREPGSGTQQILEQSLQDWGIKVPDLNVVLVFNTGEMVKAVLENNVAAGALSELMVKKEVDLDLLRPLQVFDTETDSPLALTIMRPFLKLKHCKRFQTRVAIAFEQMLLELSQTEEGSVN